MNKKILSIFSLVALMALGGCKNSSSNANYEVKVLLPDGAPAGEGISVQWCSNETCYNSKTNEQGVANHELEVKDYDVELSGYDSKYAYQLGQKATTENKNIEIKLQNILTAFPKENGIGVEKAGSPYNPYIVYEGIYSATIKSEGEIQYFGFIPNRPGKYVIESWGTSSNLNDSNPLVNYYGNNPHYVNEVLNSNDNGGYDTNFSLELNIPLQEFTNTGEVDANGELIYAKDDKGNYIPGGIYTIGISATSINGSTTFPFVIRWVEDYVLVKEKAEIVSVKEELSLFPEKPKDYIWVDSQINGVDNVVYNEEDGFYHVDTKNGYILTARISSPGKYIDRPFSKVVEDEEGNKTNDGIVGLTGIVLDNGKKDYSNFVQEYEKYCNSDGVYGVTQELKEFLELYFIHNKDFIVGKAEQLGEIVYDESGWLFASGYYADIKDSYEKPLSGKGTADDAYNIALNNEYYAKVEAGASIYYSYFIKGIQEITIYVSTTNPNAKIICNSNEYYSETGVYFETTIGGQINPNYVVFEVTTVNGESDGIVFEIGLKEKTVAGDAIGLGENTIEILEGQNVVCSFTAPRDGTYVITSEEENAWFRYNSQSYKGTDGAIKFSAELKKGDVFSFTLLTCDLEKDYITFKLSCDIFLEEDMNLISVGEREIVEYIFIAKEAGKYEFECGTDNTVIIYSEGNVESLYFGDSDENKFTLNLEANEEVVIRVTTGDNCAGSVVVIVTKA